MTVRRGARWDEASPPAETRLPSPLTAPLSPHLAIRRRRMAEREGFEPPRPFGLHDFESCAFDQLGHLSKAEYRHR